VPLDPKMLATENVRTEHPNPEIAVNGHRDLGNDVMAAPSLSRRNASSAEGIPLAGTAREAPR
jgi:hypothetical protein